MLVRWGSTYVMLNRAEENKEVGDMLFLFILYDVANIYSFQFLDDFVYELSMRETNAEKRRKIGDLTLTDDEWDRVRLFCNLLQVSSTGTINLLFFLLIFSS